MPHVVVKLVSGRSDDQKARLAAAIERALIDHAGAVEATISIAIEDVPKEAWMACVYEPEIRPALDRLHKRPGYGG